MTVTLDQGRMLTELDRHATVNITAAWKGSPNPRDPRNIRRVCQCGAVIGQLPYPKSGQFRLAGDPFDRPHREHIAEVLA